ncbi:toxin-antitoxin system YwqK family antitoxin [Streptomyces sp. NPDC001691]|uniref:toxin-antitoxin system YwqK family antitoxin n=1 Tax=unclassified Streptomyces TaxID=2593676 RepID=UPI001674DA7B|nr:hypothetical protein [Streptomyces sp. SDr-06]
MSKRPGQPTDDQLKRTFVGVLAEALTGKGVATCVGLDCETEEALWAVYVSYPDVPLDLVDAACAAFAGQLDGSNSARWHAEFERRLAVREQRSPASGPDAEAHEATLGEKPVQNAEPAPVQRIEGNRTCMDEYGRVCREEGALFTGELEERTDDGRVALLSNYFEGVEHGLQQQWWPNGAQRVEGVTNMGAAVGGWRRWYDNGQLSELVVFDKDGRKMGRKRWNAAGERIEETVTR